MKVKSGSPDSVFINLPYQSGKKAEGRFISYITAVVAMGMKPRASAEIPESSEGRLNKIIKLIAGCQHSIHELTPPPGLPRFNMPFELGLAVAANHFGNKHQFVLLESNFERVQRTISDLRRCDPYIHTNTFDSIIAKTLEAFYVKGRNPSAKSVSEVAKKVRKVAYQFKADHLQDDIYNPPVYNDIVTSALELLKADGLL